MKNEKTTEKVIEMKKDKASFKDWMNEKRIMDRWTVILIGVVGAFMGCLFTVAWMMFGLGK